MNEKSRKQITSENENHVQTWFEMCGFVGTKLETRKGRQGGSADRKFTKSNLSVVCEVKTIFSGGQSGFTPEQYKRYRLELKRKLDYYRAETTQDGGKPDIHLDDSGHIEAIDTYARRTLSKEEEFNNFLEDVRKQLREDQTINKLPFSISISIDALYVAYGNEREQFIRWLRGYALWAQEHHSLERTHSSSSFTFVPYLRKENGMVQHKIEAFVQVIGPFAYIGLELEVGFLRSRVQYNEEAITKTIGDAWHQLQSSAGHEEINAQSLPVIALWSESHYLNFSMLLAMDIDGAQLRDLPQRYYLFDWAFSEYPTLAAILLFQLTHNGDFWNPPPVEEWFPTAFVITNPNLDNADKVLKAAITENCVFIIGIDSDPLNE